MNIKVGIWTILSKKDKMFLLKTRSALSKKKVANG